MNKTVYLSLTMLEISKIVVYEFWYVFVKLNYGKKNYVTWTQITL